MAKKKESKKEIPANLVKVHEINLAKDSWESLVIKAKDLKVKGCSRAELTEACQAATEAYDKCVNEERGTEGKVYGGFRVEDGRIVAWCNGVDYRMDSFLIEYWPVTED